MAEIVAESLICNACGADIRDGSLFCYSCGETTNVTSDGKLEVTAAELEFPPENGSELRPAMAKPEKFRSAASLRKRAKVFNRQPVEYVWEKRTGPSSLFVIAAVVLTIFTGILLLLALYLR